MPPITSAADKAGSASRRVVRIDGMVCRCSVAGLVQLWLAFGRGVAHAIELAACKTLANLTIARALQSARGVERSPSVY